MMIPTHPVSIAIVVNSLELKRLFIEESSYIIDADEDLLNVVGNAVTGAFGTDDDLTLVNNFGTNAEYGSISEIEELSLLGDLNFLNFDTNLEFIRGNGSTELTLGNQFVAGALQGVATLNLAISNVVDSFIFLADTSLTELNGTSTDGEIAALYVDTAFGNNAQNIVVNDVETSLSAVISL